MTDVIGVRFSNGRKDKGLKWLIQLVPNRVGDAIIELENIIKSLKEYEERIKNNPEKYNLKREEF